METIEKKSRTVTQKPILIKRTFNLPLATVWKAWSDAESCKKWWGPNHYTCPDCTIDFREGGHYLSSMRADKDGSTTWSTGVFKEIIPHKKIVYTDSFSDSKGNVISATEAGMPGEWGKELVVTAEFKERNRKTDFTLNHKGIPPEMYDDCIKGWNECLDKLENAF